VAKTGRPEPKTTGRTLRDCVRAPAHACAVQLGGLRLNGTGHAIAQGTLAHARTPGCPLV